MKEGNPNLIDPRHFPNGEKAILLPVSRLSSLRDELARFEAGSELNEFQKWILNGFYGLDPPEGGWAKSIALVAVPHPFCSAVAFEHGGRSYSCMSLVRSDFAAAEDSLARALPEGARLQKAPNLPLKRLAAHAGLAAYGRNNVAYVEGMGSNFSLVAYFADSGCGDGGWREARMAPACASCRACVQACPTGAIRADRFLIDNERCLSAMNEAGGTFPGWLDPRVHHTLFDCLRCQEACPMNSAQISRRGPEIRFDEAETALLLAATRVEGCPPALAAKIRRLGADEWPDGVAKSMRAIIAARSGDEP